MSTQTLTEQIHEELDDLLRLHHVTVSQPRDQMLQLDDVPIGGEFNQPVTNLLLRRSGGNWQVFVDDGLHYEGEDQRVRQLFSGHRMQGWMQLAMNPARHGDVNDVIVWALHQLESELRFEAPEELIARFETSTYSAEPLPDPIDQVDRRVARILEHDELALGNIELSSDQLDACDLLAETVLRTVAPNCPLIIGPSGVGKTTVARMAARELVDRGLVDQVVEISGASFCAGAVFLPERDERLRAALDVIASLQNVLVIFEQFDLALAKSSVAAAVITQCLDRGAKVIGITRADFPVTSLKKRPELQRRIEPCHLYSPPREDVHWILQQRWSKHSMAERVELSPDVVPLVVQHSKERPGADPAAAIGLFEAIVNRAAYKGHKCVGPDDVFHMLS